MNLGRARAGWALVLILLLFSARAGLYATVIPFNGVPDEVEHFAKIRLIQYQQPIEEGRKTVRSVVEEAADACRRATAHLTQPQRQMGVLAGHLPHSDSRSLYYHGFGLVLRATGQDEPLAGWRLVRWLNILLGLGVLALIWATARRLFPENPETALLAAGLVGLIPQFGAISAGINPDNLASLTGAAFFYLMARVFRGGLGWGSGLALALLLVGLPGIKKTAYFVLPTLGLGTAMWASQRAASKKLFWAWFGATAGLAGGLLLLAAFNPTAAEIFTSLTGVPIIRRWGPGFDPQIFRQPGIVDLITQELRVWEIGFWLHLKSVVLFLFKSFWAYFGYFEVPLTWGWYAGLAGLAGAGLSGLVYPRPKADSPETTRALTFLGLGLALSLATILFRQVILSPGSLAQGRHLFPALPAIAVLWAAGWLRLPPTRAWSLIAVAPLIFLAVVDLQALWQTAVPWFYRLYL